MSGDQTEKRNKTAIRSRNKGISQMDQVRALELAVMEYKKDANDKNWSNIDENLLVSNK